MNEFRCARVEDAPAVGRLKKALVVAQRNGAEARAVECAVPPRRTGAPGASEAPNLSVCS